MNDRVDCQAGQKRPDYAREVDALGEETCHCYDRKHQNEICVLVIFHFFQDVRSQATQPKQDERHKNGDLDELHHESGHRKAALINRNADCKHDQRKRIGEYRRAERDCDGLEPSFTNRTMIGAASSVCEASSDPNTIAATG